MKLLLSIAITLLRARFKQTLVAAIGVTFGITMFVTLLSFMSGLNHMLDSLVTNRTPHIRLYNEIKVDSIQPIQLAMGNKQTYHFVKSVKSGHARKEIYNANKIMWALNQDKRVLGYSRKVNSPVFFNDVGIDISGFMNGIDANKEVPLFHFQDYVVKGNPNDLQNIPNSIILGKPLAELLFAEMGDIVQVTTTTGERFQLKVVGYYQSGLADFDKTQSFASIATVQKILGKGSGYMTDIQVKLRDMNEAPAIAKEFAKIYDLDAIDIQAANQQFETGTRVRNIISYAVGITLLVVAGFGIYNILNMMIYEKMDTIAILKATGFSGKDVKKVFLLISIIIGISGCLAGLLFSNLLCRAITHIPFNSAAVPTIKTYPVDFNVSFYVIAIIFSLLTTWLAGWFPARKASKVDPVVIIRGK